MMPSFNFADLIHVVSLTVINCYIIATQWDGSYKKFQVIWCKVGSIKTWKVCMTASVRTVSVQLTKLLTF